MEFGADDVQVKNYRGQLYALEHRRLVKRIRAESRFQRSFLALAVVMHLRSCRD